MIATICAYYYDSLFFSFLPTSLPTLTLRTINICWNTNSHRTKMCIQFAYCIDDIPLFVLWFQFWISFPISRDRLQPSRQIYTLMRKRHFFCCFAIAVAAAAIKWLYGKYVTHTLEFHIKLMLCTFFLGFFTQSYKNGYQMWLTREKSCQYRITIKKIYPRISLYLTHSEWKHLCFRSSNKMLE